jgi:signal-transduction protein with cAMP-binding, CBS, and nucleotidyltransferase domain
MDPDHLRRLPLFSSLSDDALDTVSAFAGETSVSAGELIVREGEYRYTLIVIENGTADVVKAGGIIASLGPGDVFGEMAQPGALCQHPYDAALCGRYRALARRGRGTRRGDRHPLGRF